MLCSVVKHAGGGLEQERSVTGNTRRSRVFLSTSWVLTLTSLFFLPFTPCSRSAFIPIIPFSRFSLVVSRFLVFGSLSGGGRFIQTCMLECKVLSKRCERDVKGVPFVDGRYTKGVPFLAKQVCITVRDWSLGRSLLYKTLFSTPSEVTPTIVKPRVNIFHYSKRN